MMPDCLMMGVTQVVYLFGLQKKFIIVICIIVALALLALILGLAFGLSFD